MLCEKGETGHIRPPGMVHSNLQSFLKCTTPSVPSRFLPKTSVQNLGDKWQLGDRDTVEYFTLEDLWDCYHEWSAYGAGAPIHLNDQETVVQYYTPFLSAMQLYTGTFGNIRNLREDSDLEFENDFTSTDSEGGKLSRSNSNSSNRTWNSEDSGFDQEADKRFGKLYCQYFDNDGPHLRLPLKDVINKLAERYPGLNSLRSIDLSPASWIAVAWYPIYHIPDRRNSKALYSAFLTYHTLSSSFQDEIPVERVKPVSCTDAGSKEAKFKEENDNVSLSPFGLAAYKMQRQVWLNPETEDHQTFTSLLRAAASWLTQLEVDHPDFNFFVFHSM